VSGDDYNVYIPYRIVYERLGRKGSAAALRVKHAKTLERQIEIVRKTPGIEILLATTYVEDGRLPDANEQLSARDGVASKRRDIHYNAACTYGLMQEKEKSFASLKKASGARIFQLGLDRPRY